MKVLNNKNKISILKMKKIARETFGSMVKAVVDTEREIIAIGGELHSDEETLLLESGSKQKNLWGINFYPQFQDENFVEFDSMINLRPSQGNLTRSVDDPKVRKRILEIVERLVEK